MRYVSGVLLFIVLFASRAFGGEVCAARLSELGRTPRLEQVHHLFAKENQFGMVNETKGTYLLVEARKDDLVLILYTSGLFDLFPIRREGSVKFCDTGSALRFEGLGRTESIVIENLVLQVDGGGPRRTFRLGPMPEALQRLHHFVGTRDIASP